MGLIDAVEGFYSLRGGEFNDAGSCATEIKSGLSKRGLPMDFVRRAAICAFEAEMNVIIHAVAGTLRYGLEGEELKIVVTDMGPGIEDIERAMQEGYTTAPEWAREKGWGSGLGLPNIKRNCDSLKIDSVPGQGTTLEIIVRPRKVPEDGGTDENR
jgi:anti-sigma regulatory factor (Ser/Thr protein kinase)